MDNANDQMNTIFQAIFNNTFQFIALLDINGRVILTNNTSLKDIKESLSEIQGQYFWETPWWEGRAQYQKKVRKGIEKARQGETNRFLLSGYDVHGLPMYYDVITSPLMDSEGHVSHIIVEGHNITNIKLDELKKREAESKYHILFDQSPSAMLVYEGPRIIECNPAALKMFGHDNVESVLNLLPGDLAPLRQADGELSSEKAMRYTAEALKKGHIRFDWLGLKKNGDLIRVDVDMTAFIFNGKQYLYAICRDISEDDENSPALEEQTQKLRDIIENTKSRLIQAEKKAHLSDLLPGITHEINTPMGVSVTTASFLKKQLDTIIEKMEDQSLKKKEFVRLLSDIQVASETILVNLERASNLIYSIKDIATDQISENKRLFNVRNYIDEILLSLRNELKRTKLHVNVICPEDLTILSYPGTYSQILTNLIMNSLKHGFHESDTGTIDIHFELVDSILKIEYHDDGLGMDSEVLSHIFDPYFTTKRNEGNSGLGMHITYSLVTKNLGGNIRVMSHLGEGVSFYIEVPLES